MNGKKQTIPYTVILGSLGEIKSSQRFRCPVCTCGRKFERYRLYEAIICFEFQLWGFCWNFLKVTAKSNLNSNSFVCQLLECLLCSRYWARKQWRRHFHVSCSLQKSRWDNQETLLTTMQCNWSYNEWRVPWAYKRRAINPDLGFQRYFPKEVIEVKTWQVQGNKKSSATRGRL